MKALLQAAARFIAPAALLAAAFVLVLFGAALPPSLAGLEVYGPYILFAAGAGLAIGFNRGRALLALVTLLAAYEAQQSWLQAGLATPAARAVYLALVVFVPANLAAFAVLPERGTFNRHGALRLAAIVAEVAFTAWLAGAGRIELVDWAYRRFLDPAPFSLGRIPQLGIAVTALALIVAVAAALVTRSAVAAGCAGAIVAFAIAAHVPTASLTFSIFIAAAEIMLAIAVLQDTFRMAFRDELTGLPSRRALNERLATLGGRYAIAMLDVDHFKKFNDTHGHELGDQVLRMVASHLARVGGGGTAYRYGGEEFTIVFPRKSIEQALPHLEALRAAIEGYRIALRGADRPRQAKGGGRQPGGWRARQSVSVTVSVGVAQRTDRLASPEAVIEAADRALYRAKEKGRNRVSR
ncbi:MAG TPA: GGDEF domain-containing protein [Burkholderiales bacterium]|nr:GGDEF domain-containing protein [Burkholderiales bacterium]